MSNTAALRLEVYAGRGSPNLVLCSDLDGKTGGTRICGPKMYGQNQLQHTFIVHEMSLNDLSKAIAKARRRLRRKEKANNG